jgi:hypothetical protein
LLAINPRSIATRADFSALGSFSDALSSAAPEVVSVLDAMNPTSATITKNAKLPIDSLLAGLDGLSDSSVKRDWIAKSGVLQENRRTPGSSDGGSTETWRSTSPPLLGGRGDRGMPGLLTGASGPLGYRAVVALLALHPAPAIMRARRRGVEPVCDSTLGTPLVPRTQANSPY